MEVNIISTELDDIQKATLTYYERYDDMSEVIRNQPDYSVFDQWRSTKKLDSRGNYKQYQYRLSYKEKLDNYILVHLDVENPSDIYWMSVYFSEDSKLRDHYYIDITPLLKDGKNDIIIHKSELSIGDGSPNWNKINYIRIAFESFDDKSATISDLSFASYSPQPMCTLWFDDGWKNNYTKAYPIMSSYETPLVGEISIIPSLINDPLYLSEEELNELVENNWELCNHSYSHQFLPDLSLEEVHMQIIRGLKKIQQYDKSSIGSLHFAVPYSATNEDVSKIISSSSISCRYVPEKINKLPFDRYNIGFKEVTNETDPDTVIKWIEESIQNQYWLVLMFHKIDETADERYTYSTENLKKITDYLSKHQHRIKTVTTTEVFKSLDYPIQESEND